MREWKNSEANKRMKLIRGEHKRGVYCRRKIWRCSERPSTPACIPNSTILSPGRSEAEHIAIQQDRRTTESALWQAQQESPLRQRPALPVELLSPCWARRTSTAQVIPELSVLPPHQQHR